MSYIAIENDRIINKINSFDGTITTYSPLVYPPSRILSSIDRETIYAIHPSYNRFSIAKRTVLSTLDVGKHPIDLALSGDGSRVYVLSDVSKTVSVIDTASKKVVQTISADIGDGFATGISVTADNAFIYISYSEVYSPDGRMTGVLSRIRLSDLQRTDFDMGGDIVPGKAAITSTGTKSFICCGPNNAVAMVELTIYEEMNYIEVPGNPIDIVILPGDQYAFVTNQSSNLVSVLDLVYRKLQTIIMVGNHPQGLAFSSDYKHLYVANTGDKTISKIDVASRSVIETLPITGNAPLWLATAQST